MEKHIDLWYPNVDLSAPRTENEPTEIHVGLMHVRAANDIVIDYDFERDGYRIRMRRSEDRSAPREPDKCQLEEVAFVPAWLEGDYFGEC
jgi:hypothetical protein